MTHTYVTRLLTVAAALLLSLLPLRAEPATPPETEPQTAQPDSLPAHRWQISLLTCAPGSDIYQLEGHTALRLCDSITGTDVAVNWGLFDFGTSNFVYHFVKGETDYHCGVSDTDHFLRQYQAEGRRVTEQILALTPVQADSLVTLVSINLLPANAVYRYNYVLDNCATRPLALIEQAIGDTLLLAAPETADTERLTFRNVMRKFHASYPWYQFGIDICLGSGIDRRITVRNLAFAPVSLEQMMAKATLADGKPIVNQTIVLSPGPEQGTVLSPTPWWRTPLTVGWLVFALALLLSLFELAQRNRTFAGRLFDSIIYFAFGVAGSLTLFLVCISVHYAASPNWLLLWLNPLCLLVPMLVWLKKPSCLLYYYQILNFAALIALACVWLVQLQDVNSAFVPLLLADAVRAVTYMFIARCSHRKRSRYRVNYYAP